MNRTVEDVLGVPPSTSGPSGKRASGMRFSCLFFSDVRKDVPDADKYRFMGDVTRFADQAGFEAVYFPERHFHEFGSIFANPAIITAHLIPATTRIRFRTAGVTIPLHHPAEIVEWWAMNDVLSGGRVDLGFGSGWAKGDFIFAPENYENRRQICSDGIEVIRDLWRGNAVEFAGPDGAKIPVVVYPRPIQPELSVWLLVTGNEQAFVHAGKQGYNVFTMLYGTNLDALKKKIALYRQARADAGFDPATGTVTLTLHTLVMDDRDAVMAAIEMPFKTYIKSAMDAHLEAEAVKNGKADMDFAERAKILDYAYQRYVRTAALFGSVSDARVMVDQAIDAGVNEIACLMDFGVDYDIVRGALSTLGRLVKDYAVDTTSSSAK